MKLLLVCILALTPLLSVSLFAEDGNHLTYSIPIAAKRVGPHATRDPEKKEYLYFIPGAEIARENLIAIEVVCNEVLVKRDLFKNGKKHGVQREWYPDARPKLESPYKDGRMDGVFKRWSEQGNLVGQYTMLDGMGTAIVYDNVGQLSLEDSYKNNQRDGLGVERVLNVLSLTWSKAGQLVGWGYGFYENGELADLAFFSSDGQPNGPVINFSNNGTVIKKVWYLSGREVSEDEYKAATESNSNLPIYRADVAQYREGVGDEVRAVFEKYAKMPLVKIPLQFDREGKPVLAK